jgi:hypothetical protein
LLQVAVGRDKFTVQKCVASCDSSPLSAEL